MASVARRFGGSDGVILSLGAVSTLGPGTCAVVCRINTLAASVLVNGGSNNAWWFYVDAGGGGTNSASFFNGVTACVGSTALSTGIWYLLAVTKVSAASNAPRFHIYRYDTRVWVHENSATSTTAAAPTGTNAIGARADGGGSGFTGDVQLAAYWNTDTTDANIETLVANARAWQVRKPQAMWNCNQPVTGTNVVDDSGGGANQSSLVGTSVVTGNPDFDQPIMTPGWLA
jgi:hypothetical protein